MISPERTYLAYRDLFSEVARQLGRRLDLVQRRSYGEINNILLSGGTDLAWICTGAWPELTQEHAARLLAVPIVDGTASYRAYIIGGPASQARSLVELAGTRFAFTDPLSLTGCTYPRHRLAELGLDPDRVFASTLFTHAHDNSIEAVRRGLVDAASVDSLVYDFVARNWPEELRGITVIERSPPFPIPPLVVSAALDAAAERRLGQCLRAFHTTPVGRGLLARLRVDRFEAPSEDAYSRVP